MEIVLANPTFAISSIWIEEINSTIHRIQLNTNSIGGLEFDSTINGIDWGIEKRRREDKVAVTIEVEWKEVSCGK